MTDQLTFTAPTGDLYAAVQVEASPDGETWRVVGANPAFRVEGNPPVMVALRHVTVDCKLEPEDVRIRCAWVHEDSSRGLVWTEHARGPSVRGRRKR